MYIYLYTMIQYCLKGRGRVISVLVFVHTQVNLVFVHTHTGCL